VSDDEWPPLEARARAALWAAERHLGNRDYVAAAMSLGPAVAYGDAGTAAVARGMRQLAAAGYRCQTGDVARARRHLARARERLSAFPPVFQEVELGALLEVVVSSLDS